MEEETTPVHEVRSLHQSKWYRRCLEFPLFVFFFAFSFSGSVFSNLILYKTCTVSLGYNETICAQVLKSHGDNGTKELEDELQLKASTVLMYTSLVEGVFPAIMSLFLGPWSDRNGRKPLIASSMFGYFSFYVLLVIYLQFDNLEPIYLIIAVLPYSLVGGSASLITGSFCYVSDISSESNRSFRMSILEGGLLSGLVLGSVGSSYAFQLIGYAGVFGVCAVLILIGTFYSLLVLEESVIHINAKYSNFLDVDLIREMARTCFRSRRNHARLNIWLLMLACSFGIFVMQGDTNVLYLFTREKLGWNLKTYTLYTACSIVSTVLGILVVAFVFQKWWRLSDGLISMVSYLSNVARSVTVAFAAQSWHMYLAAGVSSLRAVSGPFNRAILTKLVPPEEVGKALSLTTSLETIIPLIAGPLYTLLYKNTLTFMPGAFNLVSAALYALCFMLLGLVEYKLRRYPDHDYSQITNPVNDNQHENLPSNTI